MHVNEHFIRIWISSIRHSKTALLSLLNGRVEARYKVCSLENCESMNATEDGLMSAVVNYMEGLIGAFTRRLQRVGGLCGSKAQAGPSQKHLPPPEFPIAMKMAETALKDDWATV